MAPPSSGFASVAEIRASRTGWEDTVPELDDGPRIPLEEGAFIHVVTSPSAQGILVWAHGGGFSAGSARTHQRLAQDLARATNWTVYLVQYSLSPEAAHGVATKQLVQACLKAQETSPAVFLGGDSAGAHLALAAWETLQRRGNGVIQGLVLLSPWINLAFPPPDLDGLLKRRYRDPMVSPAALRSAASWYLGPQRLDNPGFRPGPGLPRLPPTLILVGGRELLLEDLRPWTRSWRAQGARVRISCYPGLWHVWPAWGASLPEARWAFEEIAAYFRS